MSAITVSRRRRHADKNKEKVCACPGCVLPRIWTSRFCRKHRSRSMKHGHPDGREVTAKQLKPYRELASDILERFADHPGVCEAAAWFDRLLENSTAALSLARQGNRVNSLTARELHRVRSAGLTGREALEIVVAVQLLSHYDSRTLPDDDRLTFAMANAVLRSRPYEYRHIGLGTTSKPKRRVYRVGATVRRELGTLIRDKLAPLLANLSSYVEQEFRQRCEEAQKIRTPFDINTESANG